MPTTSEIQSLIVNAAQSAGVDPELALEVASQESGFNPDAVGTHQPDPEIGVMQLVPSSFPGVNIYDVATNINTGVNYLAQMIARFGDALAGVAAYNWGPSGVSKAITQYGHTVNDNGYPAWLNAPTTPASVFNYVSRIFSALPGYTISQTQGFTAATPATPPSGSPGGPSSGELWAAGIAVVVALAFYIFSD